MREPEGEEGARRRRRIRVSGGEVGQVFQLSLQRSSDPAGFGPALLGFFFFFRFFRFVCFRKEASWKTSHSAFISQIPAPLASSGFASSVPASPALPPPRSPPSTRSSRLLTERLQEPLSHSCDLHPALGPLWAKATCSFTRRRAAGARNRP